MELLKLAQIGISAYQMSKDDLFHLLTRLELTAADEAIRKAYIAQDPKGAVYSAITHLEIAEVTCLEQVKIKENYEILGWSFMSTDAALRAHQVRYHWFSLFYIYAVMATLYYRIGENQLATYTLNKLSLEIVKWNKFCENVEWTPGHYINPKNLKYLSRKLPIESEELDTFLEIVTQWKI